MAAGAFAEDPASWGFAGLLDFAETVQNTTETRLTKDEQTEELEVLKSTLRQCFRSEGDEIELGKDRKRLLQLLLARYRRYLSQVQPEGREVPALAAAKHVLNSSRTGRPWLAMSGTSTFLLATLPPLVQLCDPNSPKYSAVAVLYHDNGLFANVLQVIDALVLRRPGVPVFVEWRRRGGEGHFQYGPKGFDLFRYLFRPESEHCRSVATVDRELPDDIIISHGRITGVFMNMFRGFFWTLPPMDLDDMRHFYGAAAKELKPSRRVQSKVSAVCDSWSDAFVVGVHKRLDVSGVVGCQLSQRMPSCDEFIGAVLSTFVESSRTCRRIVFLATDDAKAIRSFREAFPQDGIELCFRTGVKRSQGGKCDDGVDDEVHRSSACGVEDAEDALVDALCLARCSELICVDSNLAIFAALWNPRLRLHSMSGLLPEGWQDESTLPKDVVFSQYRVTRTSMQWVRAMPSNASPVVGVKQPGELVSATGRYYAGFVEVTEGGWMQRWLLDDAAQASGGVPRHVATEASNPPDRVPKGSRVFLRPCGPALSCAVLPSPAPRAPLNFWDGDVGWALGSQSRESSCKSFETQTRSSNEAHENPYSEKPLEAATVRARGKFSALLQSRHSNS